MYKYKKYKVIYGYNNIIFSNSKNVKKHFKDLGGHKICIYDNKSNKLIIEAYRWADGTITIL